MHGQASPVIGPLDCSEPSAGLVVVVVVDGGAVEVEDFDTAVVVGVAASVVVGVPASVVVEEDNVSTTTQERFARSVGRDRSSRRSQPDGFPNGGADLFGSATAITARPA